ncbi:MAG: hypothetical protein NTY21_01130 [Actinobacteria bacterium]|nr:hypothetical protein [Actinomycetota bacterium]
MATLAQFASPGVDDRKGPELTLGTFSFSHKKYIHIRIRDSIYVTSIKSPYACDVDVA